MLEAEPQPRLSVLEAELDDILAAFAEFADLKSPFTVGHSQGVAALADSAARQAGLSEPEIAELRRAALVHDLGRTGIPNGIWDKPGPLSTFEWERVRLHPYLTERILAHSSSLQRLAPLAGSHHITPKTAEHHIEHIYNKIGVSARASAALFAMEHDLIPV